MASQVETRKFIIKIFQEHPEWSFIKIAKEAGVYRGTVSNVIRCFQEDMTINRKEGSGGKKGFRSPRTAKKVVEIFKKKPNTSVRKVAQKVGCPRSTVHRIKNKSGLKTYKVQKCQIETLRRMKWQNNVPEC